ncbi:MAG: signal peptidase I [Desulfobacteraceae bacterium]|nr:signal peptidase I [Desulfobacteraceae bacterium]
MAQKNRIKENLKSIVIAVVIALFVRAFIVQAFVIPSGSMEPTVKIGDHILVNKFIYGIKIPFTQERFLQFFKPRRGDVVVFLFPLDMSKDFIKRVIATAGEKIQIINNQIYINDQPIADPWGHFEPIYAAPWLRREIDYYGPEVVPANSYFMLGDNRNDSEDSRFWGFVPNDNLIGKAMFVYFSWNSNALSVLDIIRWSRFGKWIGRQP